MLPMISTCTERRIVEYSREGRVRVRDRVRGRVRERGRVRVRGRVRGRDIEGIYIGYIL